MSALLLTAFAVVVATNEICKSHNLKSTPTTSIEMPHSSNDNRRDEKKFLAPNSDVDVPHKKMVKLRTTELGGSETKDLKKDQGIMTGWATEEKVDLKNLGKTDPTWMK